MKNFITTLLILNHCFFFTCSFARADSTTMDNSEGSDESSISPRISGSGKGIRAGGKSTAHLPISKKHTAHPLEINGNCFIIASTNNPIEGPCVNLVVSLTDLSGKELLKTRTSPEGKFSFPAESGKTYHLLMGSRYYEAINPQAVTKAGDHGIELKVRQK